MLDLLQFKQEKFSDYLKDIVWRDRDRQSEREWERQTDRQTNRQRKRHKQRETKREIKREKINYKKTSLKSHSNNDNVILLLLTIKL